MTHKHKRYYFNHDLLRVINYSINRKYSLYEIWVGCYKICANYYISSIKHYGNANIYINDNMTNDSNIYSSNISNITNSYSDNNMNINSNIYSNNSIITNSYINNDMNINSNIYLNNSNITNTHINNNINNDSNIYSNSNNNITETNINDNMNNGSNIYSNNNSNITDTYINNNMNNDSNIYSGNIYNINTNNYNFTSATINLNNNINGNINNNINDIIHNNITNAVSAGNIYHNNLIHNQSNNYYTQYTFNDNNYSEVTLPVINNAKYLAPQLKVILNIYKLLSFNKMIHILKRYIINNVEEYIVLNCTPIDPTISLTHNVNIIL